MVKILNFKFCGDADAWLRFLLMLSRDSDDEMWSRFVFELVIWPKKLLCQDELNPRVRCAFGNVYTVNCNYFLPMACYLSLLNVNNIPLFSMTRYVCGESLMDKVESTKLFNWSATTGKRVGWLAATKYGNSIKQCKLLVQWRWWWCRENLMILANMYSAIMIRPHDNWRTILI